MTTIICITILAYCILGKDIKALMEKIGDANQDAELVSRVNGLGVQ